MPSDPTRPTFTRAQRRVLTALAGLVVALQQHRAAGGDAATRQPARSRALARVGILSSILFLGAIGFSIVMLSLSPQCAG